MAHLDPQSRWKGVVACSAGTDTKKLDISMLNAEPYQATMHKA